MPHAPDLSGCALDGRYELHALIGEGTFGRVYRGRDRRLARAVAVKVIKPWWAEDPEWTAIFEREAQLLAAVSDPGIVQIFDVGHAAEGLYYVAELVEGESLADRLRRGPLPAWEACAAAAQLCRALGRAHAERIIHRDVKPANILISAEGRVKVGDFGVARLAEGTTDNGIGSVVGTPRYMAPEQSRGLPTTPATDIYSVGVVLYEMLAGHPPFQGESIVELGLAHLQESPPPLSPRLPTALIQITERALAKDPAARYADGAAMADALVEARRRSVAGRRARLAPGRTRAPAHLPAHVAARVPAHPDRRVPLTTGGGRAAGGGADGENAGRPAAAGGGGGVGARGHRAPPRRPDSTRIAPDVSPRSNVNPAARRRSAAALTAAFLLVGAMVTAAILLRPPARTRVPALRGLTRSAAARQARRDRLRATFSARYDAAAAAGTVVAQRPAAGTRQPDETVLTLVLSRGPAPVSVPTVTGESVGDAQQSLHSLGLRTSLTYVPAPGTTPGTVTGQKPAGGPAAPAGSTVALRVAETPRWHTVTTFSSGQSGPITIRGERWRVVYDMAFQGTCTWVFWCSGPIAQVRNQATGAQVGGFGLASGVGRAQTFDTGPGTYQIEITPGRDSAGWSVQVEDLY